MRPDCSQGIKGLENAGLEPQERQGQLPAPNRIRLGCHQRRPQPRARRLGHLHGHGLHQLECALCGERRDGLRLWRGPFGGKQRGIRNPDGTFYRVGQPISNIQSQNQADPSAFPLWGQWTDPRLEMPYTRQTSLGYSHELMTNTVVTMDFVRADGRDLNVRPRINIYAVHGGPVRRACRS